MIRKLILSWIVSVFYLSAHSQQSANFSGNITDRESNGIPGASIYVLNTAFRTATDAKGAFEFIDIPSGTYELRVSAVGYATVNNTVTLPFNASIFKLSLNKSNMQLEQVTVSAQKSEENAQQIPLSVTTLSATQISEYKIWNSKDITAIVPNLYSANPGDNRNVTSIRGIATTSYDPSVATYIDGVNQFGLDSYIARLLDIEQIEVLRGPQGTLYGRNAMGGVINIITKQPDNKIKGFAGLDFGNYGQQRYSLGLRAPLVKNKLFLGVAGLYDQQGGFSTNDFYNDKFDKQHAFVGNYYLKFLASSRLSMTLNVKHNENRNNGTFPLAGSIADAIENPFKVNQNAVTQMADNLLNSSLSLNYYGSAFNFSSQTAYQTNSRIYKDPIDGDFSPIDGISIVNNYGGSWNKVKTGTQEFRFTSPASSNSPIKWVAGTYGFYQDNPVKQGTHFGKDAALVGADFPDFTLITINNDRSYGVAVYGQGSYTISPQLDFTLGMRYDYEHKKQHISGVFQMDGGEPMETRSDTSSSATFKAFSPKASMIYRFTEAHNLYSTYSRGFRAGGISDLTSDPAEGALYIYKPEYSNSFELGSKNTFLENRLRLNLAVFYNQITDAQVPALILPDAITVTRNAGKLNSKGAELELAATPFKNLEVNYSLGYTDAKYTNLQIPSRGTIINLESSRQVFTPDVTSMLALQYGYELGIKKQAKLLLRSEWRYLGNQYFDLANQLEQKAYSLFNARLGVATAKFDIFLWSSNIANKRYVDYAYNFGAAHLGNPQTYGISLTTKF
ncbi:MAG: TonB-dependent receptor [Sphingobacteriaceae bacterium]